MKNKLSKNLSLILAAASVASIVPTQTAFAATRLETKDGTIEKAIAYKNGTFMFDGYLSDDDDTGVYLNSNKTSKVKDSDGDEIEDGKLVSRFGEKYAVVEDDDNYVIDLETGKAKDDMVSDIEDTAKNKLKSALKKADRYEVSDKEDITSFKAIKNQSFGKNYYVYKAKTDGTKTQGKVDATKAKAELNVEKLANNDSIVVAGKTIVKTATNVETNVETNADANVEENTAKASEGYTYTSKEELATVLNTIAELDEVKAKYDVSVTDGVYTFTVKADENVKENEFVGAEGITTTAFTNSEDVKKVEVGSYFGITDENGKYIDVNYKANMNVYSNHEGKMVKVDEFNTYDSSKKVGVTLDDFKVISQDKDNFYAIATVTIVNDGVTESSVEYLQKISKSQDSDKEDDAYLPKSVTSYQLTSGLYTEDDVDDAVDAIKNAKEVIAKDGKLYAIELDSDKVTVTSISLKQTKLKFEQAPEGFKESEKVYVYTVMKETDEDADIESEDSYSIDVDGNLWIINSGKIQEFTGSKFETKYACDTGLDRIDVYDSENIVAWEDGDDVYATTSDAEKDKTDVKDDTTDIKDDTNKDTTVVLTEGWHKDVVTGTWSFVENGTKAVSKWVLSNGAWYHLGADGIMQTGWLNDNGTWYYLQSSGAMQTGWLNDNGTWYYLQSSGAMQTGWLNDNGTWYYLQPSGAMQTGWLDDNGTWYYLSESGAMLHDTTVGGYQLASNGAWIR